MVPADHVFLFNRIVLSSSQLARRWRGLTNSLPTQDILLKYEEIQWREQVAHNLSAAHTLGGMAELTLEPVESQYSVIILPPDTSCTSRPYTLLYTPTHFQKPLMLLV